MATLAALHAGHQRFATYVALKGSPIAESSAPRRDGFARGSARDAYGTAAVTTISTFHSGLASLACTVARAGVKLGFTHFSHA